MMPDDSSSPDLAPETSAPLDAAPDSPSAAPANFTLTPEQSDTLGLTDCQPGDSYTFTVHVAEGEASAGLDGAGKTFEIDSAEPAAGDDTAEAPPEGTVATPQDEETMLGYKRPRSTDKPFPPIKNLRG